MSTRASLRRSRRAPKKVSEYNVGDIVQISRGNTMVNARLAQLLTEGSSPNPRWLIKFDEHPYKDEEVYEHTFGKGPMSDDVASPESGSVNSPQAAAAAVSAPIRSKPVKTSPGSPGKKSNSSSKSSASSEGEVERAIEQEAVAVGGDSGERTAMKAGNGGTKKTVSFSNEREGSPLASDSSMMESGADPGKVSAREERSRRRQAIIDEHGPLAGVVAQPPAPSNSGKRKSSSQSKSKSKRSKSESDEECVKIKLLTGTLFLYKGRHRRAEFIRRV